MKLVFFFTFLDVIVAGVALDNEKPADSLEHSTGLRKLGWWHGCKHGEKDQGCGCGKPPPGNCGCDITDYGCGCGKPGPGKCGCDLNMMDYGCGCGNPAPLKCGCKAKCCEGWDNHVWLKSDIDKCIQYDIRDPDLWAEMGPCISSNSYQKWYFEQGSIKSVEDSSMCLAYKTSGHSRKWLFVARCNGSSNQKWNYANQRINPLNLPNKCADLCRDCGNFLYLEKCESSRNDDQEFLVGDCFFNYE